MVSVKPDLRGLVDDPAEVVAHPAEGQEVLVHQLAGLARLDAQLLAEAERGQAVGEAVVHRLDLGPHRGGDGVGVDVEDPGGGDRVEVAAGLERLDQQLVLGEVGHDPHLDLAVVGRHQGLEALAHHEALADPAPLLGADRDVLQVGLGAGEPAGRRDGLVERGVDPPVGGHGLEQALDGLPEPRDVAVSQQRRQEGVLGLDVELLERVGVGGVAGLGALGLRHVELVEQHHLQLLGRPEVDLLADDREGLVGRLLLLGGEVALQRLEVIGVDRDADLLHRGEQVDERQLHLGQQPRAAVLLDLVVERFGEVEDRARVEHRDLRRPGVLDGVEGSWPESPVSCFSSRLR